MDSRDQILDHEDPYPDFEASRYEASLSKRFVNFWLDLVSALLFSLLLLALNYYIFAVTGKLLNPLVRYGPWPNLAMHVAAYFLLFEAIFGKTIGKVITKTKVVNHQGFKPNPLVILWRTALRFLPFDLVGFLRQSEQPLHDNWSGTLVIFDSSEAEQKRWNQLMLEQEGVHNARQAIQFERKQAERKRIYKQFENRFQSLSPKKLRFIVDNPQEHEPEAVTVAQQLLEKVGNSEANTP